MSAENAPGRLMLLLALAVVLLLASGAAYYLLQTKPEPASQAVPVAALYETALDATAAAAGEPQALASSAVSYSAATGTACEAGSGLVCSR